MLEEKNVVVSSGEECLDGCQPIMLTSAAGKGQGNGKLLCLGLFSDRNGAID